MIKASLVNRIDSHAHIFTLDLPFLKLRRYTPTHEATLTSYLAMLDQHGFTHGVLIQPSFLGTDNSFLIHALKQTPRLKGVICIDSNTPPATLQQFNELNIVGVRLNLIKKPLPDLSSPEWKTLLSTIKALNWHIELHCFSNQLSQLLPPLITQQVKVVIDHFGRPINYQVSQDQGFLEMLDFAKSGFIWCKLSGLYRNTTTKNQDNIFIKQAIPLLLKHLGAERLMWGSDWPHTQHETYINYSHVASQINTWLPDPAIQQTILWDTPAKFFNFTD